MLTRRRCPKGRGCRLRFNWASELQQDARLFLPEPSAGNTGGGGSSKPAKRIATWLFNSSFLINKETSLKASKAILRNLLDFWAGLRGSGALNRNARELPGPQTIMQGSAAFTTSESATAWVKAKP